MCIRDRFSTIPADDSAADEYNEQLGLVNADCQVLLNDDAQELLSEAGCTDVDTAAWSEQTAGVLGLVMAAEMCIRDRYLALQVLHS